MNNNIIIRAGDSAIIISAIAGVYKLAQSTPAIEGTTALLVRSLGVWAAVSL